MKVKHTIQEKDSFFYACLLIHSKNIISPSVLLGTCLLACFLFFPYIHTHTNKTFLVGYHVF